MASDTGAKRMPCPLHGCRRVYSNIGALELHVKEHQIPAQSIAGKVLLCSTTGCSGSFPNMQKLMEHTRHHHKPNIFFMCESCRTKLRSYRGLLTHLHTCSKVPRAKAKPVEPSQPQPAGAGTAVTGTTANANANATTTSTAAAAAAAAVTNPNITATSVDQRIQRQDPTSTPQQAVSQLANLQGNFPTAPRPGPTSGPLLRPSVLSFPEGHASPQLTGPPLQQPVHQPPPLNSDGQFAAPEPSGVRVQNQMLGRSPQSVQPAPLSAPQSPPGPTAIWRKSQGMACYSRILWEHTKGMYTCVQCGQTAANRKEMTHHINAFHSGPKAAEESRKPASDT